MDINREIGPSKACFSLGRVTGCETRMDGQLICSLQLFANLRKLSYRAARFSNSPNNASEVMTKSARRG